VHGASQLSLEARATLADWFARGHPAVVCRHESGDAAGVPLSVTLPASRWLATIRFTVGRAAVVRRAPPLPLAEAMLSAPPEWRAPLSDLERAAAGVGVPLSVTGALSWQHVTGEQYVSPRSPVELLFRPRTRQDLNRILAVLRVREDGDGPHLAGEVLLGWDAAVAWRDLAHGRRRVLVRSLGGEAVADVERLLAGLR
jgi:phosphoribosyl-dephospho-CoA transferase